jgi:hypothetical protein
MFKNASEREIQYVIAVVIFVVGALGMSLIRLPSPVPAVSGVVGRGSNLLVLRFPESPQEQREEIILRDREDESATLLRVFVTTGEQTQQGIVSELTVDQEMAWRQFYMAWCQREQISTNSPREQAVFEIAVRCPLRDGYLGTIVEFDIAAAQLPAELRELIRNTPSPSCEDPLCGW